MNANVTKSNSGKLLIAVLAMAMIVAGCAVVFSDETQAATVDEMTFLDEKLSHLGDLESIEVDYKRTFSVDDSYSHFFEVLSGTAVIATTWREMPESDEVTGLFTLKAGEAALFLPGEPFLVKPGQDSQVSEFVLR